MAARTGGSFVLRDGEPVRVAHSGGKCRACQIPPEPAPVSDADTPTSTQEPAPDEDA